MSFDPQTIAAYQVRYPLADVADAARWVESLTGIVSHSAVLEATCRKRQAKAEADALLATQQAQTRARLAQPIDWGTHAEADVATRELAKIRALIATPVPQTPNPSATRLPT